MSKSADAYVDAPAGEAIFREGEPGQAMFIIETGQVEIRLAARGSDAVASLGPGDFFGEMAMLEDQPRFATAIAREPSRLLRIERAQFADLVRQNFEIGVRIMRKLSARHRRAEARLAEALAEIARLRSGVPATRKQASAPAAAAPAPPPVQPPAVPKPVAAKAPKAQEACQLRHASGQVFPLDPATAQFLVGRPDPVAGINPEIDLSGIDATRSLSRRHAKLVREGRLYFVREEVGTVNGTFVNGVRVTTGVDVAIKPGDKLRFGAVEVDFAVA